MKCFLRIGEDCLEEATQHKSLAQAESAYRKVAEELGQYGQSIEATIHIAKTLDEVAEYPDFVLTYEDDCVIKISA
jgi:hypothetical protein